jgi:hypothetical protein
LSQPIEPWGSNFTITVLGEIQIKRDAYWTISDYQFALCHLVTLTPLPLHDIW